MNKNQRVTYIDDLPDLEDIENNYQYTMYNSDIQTPNVTKFIRNDNGKKFHENSGMNIIPNIKKEHFSPKQNIPQPSTHPVPHHFREHFEESKSLSCIDISEHIKKCPVCSQLYNNDKTIYLIVIFFLCLICLLLLKKVLHI